MILAAELYLQIFLFHFLYYLYYGISMEDLG